MYNEWFNNSPIKLTNDFIFMYNGGIKQMGKKTNKKDDGLEIANIIVWIILILVIIFLGGYLIAFGSYLILDSHGWFCNYLNNTY